MPGTPERKDSPSWRRSSAKATSTCCPARSPSIGYGSQGHAHALNLHDSGVQRPGRPARGQPVPPGGRGGRAEVRNRRRGRSRRAARRDPPARPGAAAGLRGGDRARTSEPGAALLFAHGFNVLYGRIEPPAGHDVIMVAPKGPGHIVRRLYTQGLGTPALIAVAQDASGRARDLALAYAVAIGAGRAGMLETTFKEETETDLFGEQAVLCGGVSGADQGRLRHARRRRLPARDRLLRVLHELKLIVDLIWEGGLSYMRYSISDTAEYGDYTRGPVVIDKHVRETMKKVLSNIQSGQFAKEWIAEMEEGEANLKRVRGEERASSDREGRRRVARADGEAGGAWPPLTSRSRCSGTARSGRRSTGPLRERGRHRARDRAPPARRQGARTRRGQGAWFSRPRRAF